jgi:chloramphenicol 3-O-phosphotransferase
MLQKLLLLLLLPALFAGCAHMKTDTKKTRPGSVIILNGPSVAGKSSIQRAFQKIKMPNLWVKVGIDNLFDLPMPDINLENLSFWQSENAIRWVTTTKDSDGNNVVTLHVGEQGEKVAYAMNSAIKSYAENGCNVIVDYIAYKKEWLDDLKQKLAPYQAYYVAVDISLEEIERRELARQTSPVGHARSHYGQVYWDQIYDLRVDSEKNSAEEIALKIDGFISGKL